MAAELTAVFKLVDEMDSSLEKIATSGDRMVSQFERAERASNSALSGIPGGSARAVQAVDGVARSVDTWTSAVGTYDKSALEAVYSTEELVKMGFKTEEALTAATSAQEDQIDAVDRGAKIMADFRQTIDDQEKELDELREAYMGVVLSSGEESEEAKKLKGEIDSLSKTVEDNRKELEGLEKQSGKTSEAGIDAISALSSALATAGIAKLVKEIASEVYELATAFSEAESTIVKATGASGDALDSLTGSMMRVYSTAKDATMDSTAAAIGEINTRLGYTDELLERTTSQFLDFASVTNGNVTNSVRTVTQLMNQWNVENSKLGLTLDKLTYAGQVSGISVDGLTGSLTANQAILTELGFTLDESIALFAQFERSGVNAATVMTGFRTALSKGDISSLEDLTKIFDKIKSGAMGAADAAEVFGNRAGTYIVDSVRKGIFEIDDMVAALQASEGTLNKTATAAQTLDQKWTQASNNISVAFTKTTQLAVEALSGALADMVNGFGEFLNENPEVTKAITAAGVALGVLVVGVAGVTFATTVAIPAISAFGVALNTALGPIGWVALGITAIGTALGVYVALSEEAEDETAHLTVASKEQYYQLQDLNAEYEKAVQEHGEFSEEALRLRYEVDDLTASYESNKKSISELISESRDLADAISSSFSEYNETVNAINEQEVGVFALVQKYQDLSNISNRTAGEQGQLEAVMHRLDELYPDVAEKADRARFSTEQYADALMKAAQDDAASKRAENIYNRYVDALVQSEEATEKLDEVNANLMAKEFEYGASMLNGHWVDLFGKSLEGPGGLSDSQLEELNGLWEVAHSLGTEYEESMAFLESSKGKFEELSLSMAMAAKTPIEFSDAVSTAILSVEEDMQKLAESYDAAYEAAYSSIDGQIGLFDKMETKSELTTSQMLKSFESQIEYLDKYNENLLKAQEYGLSTDLIAKLSDGSQESAGYLNAIVQQVDKLGKDSTGARDFINNFNTQFARVQEGKDQFAENVRQITTDFDEQLDAMKLKLEETIDGMTMDSEAQWAAKSTMDAYIEGIRGGMAEAESAAHAVAAATARALETTNPGGNTTSSHSMTYYLDRLRPGYATGTLNSAADFIAGESGPELIIPAHAAGTLNGENAYIAGDNGPELIIGAPGSTVFPSSETDRLIRAINEDRPQVYIMPYATGDGTTATSDGQSGGAQRETIHTIRLEGIGEIKVDSSMSKEEISEILYERMRPVLLAVLADEMTEEGDESYIGF